MKEKIRWVLTGLLIACFGFYAFWFYNMSKVVSSDHQTIVQIVNLINNSQKQTQDIKK